MSEASIKGRRLEQAMAALLRRHGLDKGAKRMHRSGGIEHRKGDVYTQLRYSIECKAQERVELWAWWNQARGQARMGRPPLLVISGDNRPILVVMDVDTAIDLLKTEQDYLAQIPERAPLTQRQPRGEKR